MRITDFQEFPCFLSEICGGDNNINHYSLCVSGISDSTKFRHPRKWEGKRSRSRELGMRETGR